MGPCAEKKLFLPFWSWFKSWCSPSSLPILCLLFFVFVCVLMLLFLPASFRRKEGREGQRRASLSTSSSSSSSKFLNLPQIPGGSEADAAASSKASWWKRRRSRRRRWLWWDERQKKEQIFATGKWGKIKVRLDFPFSPLSNKQQ